LNSSEKIILRVGEAADFYKVRIGKPAVYRQILLGNYLVQILPVNKGDC
jgi:hypothetical protein